MPQIGVLLETGVYTIVNTINDKVYIGSTVKSFKNRWSCHRRELRLGRHVNPHLQSAWIKYGESAFDFLVAERCPPEECLRCEQRHLDAALREGIKLYNMCLIAGSALGIKRSEETKRKLSLLKQGTTTGPLSEDHKERISLALAGREFSEEHKRNVSLAKKGRPGKKLSEETKKKLSLALSGRPKRKRSEAHKRNLSLALRGRVVGPPSEETRRRISLAQLGKKLSEEHRHKLSLAKLGNRNATRKSKSLFQQG